MKRLVFSLAITAITTSLFAKPNVDGKAPNLNKTAAGCNATTAVIDLDVNNVRARLMNGGDMWWEIPTGNASYEVPKGSNKNSLFSGSIWIGGVDKSTGLIKVAAQTYRQTGNDYWTGPLDENNNYNISFQTCADWDRFWKINAADINTFRKLYNESDAQGVRNNAILQSQADVPDIIKEWPGRKSTTIKSATGGTIPAPNREMAEFVDIDNDGIYNWTHGDYPKILGDQYIWWVFNDKGDAKTETTSEAIGLEIHAGAFAFSTNDCLNEATFYNYKVYNFSTNQLDSTYMATWCDADLGYAFDDFVGCDTARGLGILYNGDAFDEGAQGYGFDLPMVGVDYFQGPKYTIPGSVPARDTELKMTVFTYYNNTGGPTGNPSVLDDFYGFMTGTWKDGQPFTTAPNARDAGFPTTRFIFYGDPCKGGWSEASANNTPNDRRFIHSSGPFPLVPGAAPNDITIGAVWVPNAGAGKSACFSKIQICDDKAQDLFDNSFKLPFGPQAPQVTIQEMDKKIVFDLDNMPSSNNYQEGYGTNLARAYSREVSKKAVKNGSADSLYKFEGYIVYQLASPTVSLSDIRAKDGSINTSRARIVYQCDKKNGVKEIINHEVDPSISTDFYTPRLMMTGADNGIEHSFQITTDAFAQGTSKNLVNYKTYYYMVLAYGYNGFRAFDPTRPDSTQDRPYIESRTDGAELPIKVIAAIPHPANDSLYVQTYADYGTGIQITRLEGKGNSGIPMELTEQSENEALANGQAYQATYKPNLGPLKLKVVNPNKVQKGEYEVWFDVKGYYRLGNSTASANDTSKGAKGDSTMWFITKVGTQDTVWSETTIQDWSEKYLRKYDSTGKIIFDWGISADMKQQIRPGDNPKLEDNGNIKLENEVLFDDINDMWLSGLRDNDGTSFSNWIRAGSSFSDQTSEMNGCRNRDWDNSASQDPITGEITVILNNPDQMGSFEKYINGTFAPYNLVWSENVDKCGWGLMPTQSATDRGTRARLQNTYSIDLVFTSDKSKWTRCAVIEMTDNNGGLVSQGGANKFTLRRTNGFSSNVNDLVNADGTPKYSQDANDQGMSWFPGYAINIETGERLNIVFGEESFNAIDKGNDMIWNPSSVAYDPTNGRLRWGGKHIIYVQRTKYDQGVAFANAVRTNLTSPDIPMRVEYGNMMWVGVPLLAPGMEYKSWKDGLIPTTTRLKLRVQRPYSWYTPDPGQTLRNNGWPLYKFNTNDIAPAPLGDAANSYTNNKEEIFKRIHVVPNPYYAYSTYEGDRLDTRVKIINLPERATIKIYTIDGALVKTINKNDAKSSFVDWDIKNDKGVPIASGMYLVHVNLPGIGETVLKWFGAMRPIDITSF